ncbi:tripartite tricarboxylate transporter TctB family protein [Arcobacter sp.]|uniref:tripartite tricarboxylate transporter TctB family protein n=1 Tax=Arcobacter sp. TaxID=1872629 RepID=UPI003C77EF0A
MIKKIYLEIIIAISLVGICLAGLIFEVSTYSGTSSIMPYGVLTIAGVLSLFWFIQSILELRKTQVLEKDVFEGSIESKRFFVFFCITLIYVIGITLIGFFTATIIAIPIISISMGYRSLMGIAVTTVLFTAIIFIVFSLFLKVPLPLEIWNKLLGAS